MKILITAGPTREYLDRVRYLSNPSTGRMGYEIARAAKSAGHSVTLVSGPSFLEPPAGIRLINVTTADEMFNAVRKSYQKMDAVIMTAAVSNYKPVRYHPGKIKKTNRPLTIRFVPTIDILEYLGRHKGKRQLIGFALETDNHRANARRKLQLKNLDYIVLNTPDSFGTNKTNVEIWGKDGLVKRFRNTSKYKIGEFLISLLSRSEIPLLIAGLSK
ncbi:MAG: phosphopantothenoylcysteine decarboxylase [Planctomycetes bacterium]|nr:phosphopantothenoylcysteine decarboxylase [Planctomycetota bacterium]